MKKKLRVFRHFIVVSPSTSRLSWHISNFQDGGDSTKGVLDVLRGLTQTNLPQEVWPPVGSYVKPWELDVDTLMTMPLDEASAPSSSHLSISKWLLQDFLVNIRSDLASCRVVWERGQVRAGLT